MEQYLPELFGVAVTIGLALGGYWLAHFLLNHFLLAFLRSKRPTWVQPIERSRLVMWIALLALLAVLYVGIPFAVVNDGALLAEVTMTVISLAFVVDIALLFNAVIDIAINLYERRDLAKRVPLRGLAQLSKVLLFIIFGVIGVAVFFQVPSGTVVASIAAVTAAAGFIFKDPILGFVAGIQLAGNNMLAIGDSVQMPKYGADGAVREITMTTVKVQNWDNSVTMIPSYSMVSDSFVNWRTMFESGGKRIKRAIPVDVHTIAQPAPAILAELAAAGILVAELGGDDPLTGGGVVAAQSLQSSNLGLFCAYMTRYLRRNPDIVQDKTVLVHQLEHSEEGLPIEIIAFCKKTDLPGYAAVQGEIFEHAYMMLPRFGLRAYQRQRSGNYVAPEVSTE